MRSPAAIEQSPLERVLSGAPLDAMAAAAELTDPESEPRDVLRAFRVGDALARVLLLPSLAASGQLDALGAVLAALAGGTDGEREHAAWALAGVASPPGARRELVRLRRAGGFGGMLAGLALEPRRRRPHARLPAARSRNGLRVVQVVMQGAIDAGLTRSGAGDAGGLATLVVQLSRALADHPQVAEVVSLVQGTGDRASREPVGPGAWVQRVPLGHPALVRAADLWSHRVAIETGLERALRSLGRVDVVHLRFADAGTLAAARVCERLAIPVVFTLAPDPHGPIRARERHGLGREDFLAADRVEHLIFRARLVERLRDRAAGLALLPRRGGHEELRELLGVVTDDPTRTVRTIPEGISMAAIDSVARAPYAPSLRVDPDRLGLPVILSVGRLHRVKGFGRLVEAWAGAPDLRDAFNLVIVGGELAAPSAEERAVLADIDAALRRHPAARPGLTLAGRRPHGEALALMAAARYGSAPSVGPDGVYACASDKEEFGLALLEATATGLSVVGPDRGGPPSYLRDGVTGTLADTTTVAGLRDGIRRAVAARRDGRRAVAATRSIRRGFTVEAMADALVGLYADAVAA